MKNSGIVLVGMPGAGKSTIGVLLAKLLGYAFIDTDLIIQTNNQLKLQQIIDQFGYQRLRKLEEEALLTISSSKSVVATGGSAVYSKVGMGHISTDRTTFYLEVPIDILEDRVTDYATRGIAGPPGSPLTKVFEDRHKLYLTCADQIIPCANETPNEIVELLIGRLQKEISS